MRTILLLGVILLLSCNKASGVEEFILFVTPDQLRAAATDRIVGPREERLSGKIINVFGTGDLKVEGDNNTIILAMAGRVSVNGSSNRIFARRTSQVSLEGATNEVTHEADVVLADKGVGSLIKRVEKIVIKTGAPASGADISSFLVVGALPSKAQVEQQAISVKLVENPKPEVPAPASTGAAKMPEVTGGAGLASLPKQPLPSTALAAVTQEPLPSSGKAAGNQPLNPTVGSTPAAVSPSLPMAVNGGTTPTGPTPVVGGPPHSSSADSAVATKAGGPAVKPVGEGSLIPMSAEEKQKWDDALSLIGKIAPSVVELVNKLPGAGEAPLASPGEAVGVPGQRPEIDSVLVGAWEIESVSTSDAMLTLFSLKMSGSFQFNEDGSGFMKAKLGVKGISLDRSATFLWSATPGVLTMNRGLENESKWERTKLEASAQEAKITTKDGTELILKLAKPINP